jgi:cytochrome P450
MFGDGIFTQEGEAWKHSRLMLRPQLTHRQYEDLKLFDGPMNDLLDSLPQSGGVIDLQPLFFRFTLDVTTAFLFGESVRSLKSAPGSPEQSFAAAFDLAQSYVIQRFRLLDLYWLIGGRKFRDACRQVNEFADKVIDQNLEEDITSQKDNSETGRYVFLRAAANSFPNRAALRGQIVNILAAGRDTTACLLSWTLWVFRPFGFSIA